MAHAKAKSILGGKRKKVGRKGQKLVSEKIPVLMKEGMPQRQAVATALSMQRAGRLREGGVYVPAKKK